ncbi:MAG: hypothetical protein A3C85_00810 [Candidatus Doudnabacteria bacterium RIFCSPHIGHO2_02_FULL_48_21]|uniref:PPM-type phosphatase domain-containing protein n=1 Tax=Candidatus Doudnabacteria bacterium RIFCSPLOWO2_02_FULL_48_13 TaxID=1817845 RepID=A0A1F5QB60_9BACT|nr:MAG: hypothetical protein A3K05_04800 [Candidatus Doudnabacteria bacterium RIFCSPHIGHO2_01_48_18]OGE77303.1 MAG: hypothetical protein A2668_02650 [Candidatus Doudnabacteria bacterium RIFCSPHIGHO2_01_FULL_48_180]OGE92843.1 MAG: hypothetical protein A3C85_00810 [Candidatus Doudnabacteria bacterium RIFCSPHIGHO2_02_FULL_48_21]OGE96874.1 MAG: hypothetical protein A3A83_04045 [Candidatus Doudnabacteria bacterium RIFCSPLOWO2_01_FULL_48_57]OGE99433.1 MAG: hypothetical protein A3J05_03775 [Candidatus
MKLKTTVGQIFLTHPKDGNFTSVYEESFGKLGQTIDLFAVIEVSGIGPQILKANKLDYDKLTRTIVGALKRTYIAAMKGQEDIFEKALANINSSLSRLAAKEKINWFGRLNVAIAAVCGSELWLSTTGNSVVYLWRDGEFSLLSGELGEEKIKPTKLFSNFSSGGLAPGDRVLLSNRELLNFLSMERLEGFLSEETLEDVCAEIIAALSDIKDAGFATYVFETSNPDKSAAQPAVQTFKSPAEKNNLRNFAEVVKYFGTEAFHVISAGVSGAARFIAHFFRVRPKKYLFIAITLALVLFLGNLAWASWRKSSQTTTKDNTAIAASIDQKLTEAESALIYENENGAVNLLTEIDTLFADLDANAPERAGLEGRLADLKNKVAKESRVDNPTVLTQFAIVPSNLARSPNGFLGFNQNSGRLAFYDFRVGTTKNILQNRNTGNLAAGFYLGTNSGYAFLNKNGGFQKLDVDTETLTDIAVGTAEGVLGDDLGHSRALAIFGADSSARIYILDSKNNQIWRMSVNDSGIAAPERWLKGPANFPDSVDIAVDGSVYVLYPDRVEKYFNGARQPFQLAAVSPPLKSLTGIVASADLGSIYLLDPANKRVVVMSKQGGLQKQIISDKFRELSDIYVDEKAGIIYALAGSELLQISF